MNDPITQPATVWGLVLPSVDSLVDLARQEPMPYAGFLLINLIACQALLSLASRRARAGRSHVRALWLAARLGQAYAFGLALLLAKVRLS